MYVLVRHAHAGRQKDWAGADSARPLTERGRQQAAGIADNLRAMDVTALISSPYLRCRQTLEPLAGALHIPVTTSDLLLPEAPVDELDRLLSDPALEGAVLCTHGEVLNALLHAWQQRHELTVEPDSGRDLTGSTTEKGGAWIVESPEPARAINYLRPVHVGPPQPSEAIPVDAGK